jgi:hypothetical protein
VLIISLTNFFRRIFLPLLLLSGESKLSQEGILAGKGIRAGYPPSPGSPVIRGINGMGILPETALFRTGQILPAQIILTVQIAAIGPGHPFPHLKSVDVDAPEVHSAEIPAVAILPRDIDADGFSEDMPPEVFAGGPAPGLRLFGSVNAAEPDAVPPPPVVAVQGVPVQHPGYGAVQHGGRARNSAEKEGQSQKGRFQGTSDSPENTIPGSTAAKSGRIPCLDRSFGCHGGSCGYCYWLRG